MLGDIPNATTIEQATHEKFKAWFHAALAEAPLTLLVHLNAVSQLTYKQCDEDPSGAPQEFCQSTVNAPDRQNIYGDMINDSEKCETFIHKIINKVEPEYLRLQIRK